MAMTTLQWPDYVILAAFLGISLGIGFYHSVTGGRQKTIQEFVMADRKLGVIPTAMSLFVSFQSAILVIGSTAEMYLFGVQYLVWATVSFSLALILTDRLLIPWIYPLKLVSINDYLEQRFESRTLRVLGAFFGILGSIMYMGVAMYAPSAALESATGLPMTVSIPLMAVVSIAYTSLGGMRAVIWTDVFQFAILMGGLLAILIKGLIVVGGVDELSDICAKGGRLETTNWSVDPTERHTAWTFLLGGTVGWCLIYGIAQASMQRYSATDSLVKARITVLINIPGLVVLYVLVCSIGLTVYAYYASIRCDPLVNKQVSSPNQLLSLFVMTIFSENRGFSGLFLSTLYGGALSSVSSSLSGSAANCWDDILKWKLSAMLERRKALLNRMLVVIFGALATGFAFLAATFPGPILQASYTFGSSIAGPVYGVYLLAGLSKYANRKGTLVGGLCGLCINLWLVIGSFRLHHRLPILPPASIEGCIPSIQSVDNATWFEWTAASITTQSADSFNHVTSTYAEIIGNSSYASQSTHKLVGIQKFYAVSYMWYAPLGLLVTYLVGITVSLIFRDREAEARIPDRLLIPFHKFFSWSDASCEETVGEINGNFKSKTDDGHKEETGFLMAEVEVKVNGADQQTSSDRD